MGKEKREERGNSDEKRKYLNVMTKFGYITLTNASDGNSPRG